jgi:hypothetical protein
MGQAIYALNMSVAGATSAAYYSIALSSGTTGPGSFSITPGEAQYTYVSFQGGITFSGPGGVASAGALVTTANDLIAGDVYVSPPVNVPVQINLYYQGQIIQAYEVAPGQSEGNFSWKVTSDVGADEDPKAVLDAIIARPKAG